MQMGLLDREYFSTAESTMTSLTIFSVEEMLSMLGVLSILWLFLEAAWGFARLLRTYLLSVVWKGVNLASYGPWAVVTGATAGIGKAYAKEAAWGFARLLRTYLLSVVWKGVNLASYGPWAVVTGATAGIGKAYAKELARRGLNVVLISRSLEKLKPLAAEIEEQHGRSTKVIQADFTGGSEIYEPIRAALQGLEIGILVNNVGQSLEIPICFLDSVYKREQCIDDLVNCNMLSAVKMTQMILPQMVARKKGIIINLSSESANRPVPLAVLYSATKVFDDFFSQALDIEYRSKGIIVQSILPCFVESNMSQQVKRQYKMPADNFAWQALNTVGLSSRTSGAFNHCIQRNILALLIPEWLQLSPAGVSYLSFLWNQFLGSRRI